MLIQKPNASTGICFAWKPKITPDGKIWLEFVRWKYNDTEFGSYSYERLLPQKQWETGKAA